METPEDNHRDLRVAAVFVSYECGAELVENVRLLGPQVDLVVVVDNGSAAPSGPHLLELEQSGAARVIRLGRNHGIARALNEGMRHAAEAGCDWVVTMDQDSRPDAHLVADLLRDVDAHAGAKPIAIVAPLIYGAEDRLLIQGWAGAEGAGAASPQAAHEVVTCMTSGALTRTAWWSRLGGFDEGFFIDYVDTDYCLRCLAAGAVVLQSFRASLFHHLGNRRSHRIGRVRFSATHHSAFRRYFITRNRILTWRRFARAQPRYVLDDAKGFVVESAKILLVEDDKWNKARATLRGAADAIFLPDRRGHRA